MAWEKDPEFAGTPQEFEIREVPDDERVPEKQRYTRTPTGRQIHPKCGRQVHQGRASYPCSRDAVVQIRAAGRPDAYLCKPHLTGERRSRQKQLKDSAAYEEKQQREDALEERLNALGRRLGISVRREASMGRSFGYSLESASVSIAELEDLAERLAELEQVIPKDGPDDEVAAYQRQHGG